MMLDSTERATWRKPYFDLQCSVCTAFRCFYGVRIMVEASSFECLILKLDVPNEVRAIRCRIGGRHHLPNVSAQVFKITCRFPMAEE